MGAGKTGVNLVAAPQKSALSKNQKRAITSVSKVLTKEARMSLNNSQQGNKPRISYGTEIGGGPRSMAGG